MGDERRRHGAYYQERNFGTAARMFEDVGRKLPGDFASRKLRDRCLLLRKIRRRRSGTARR